MININYLQERLVVRSTCSDYVPRVGDTVRFGCPGVFYKVNEVIWAYDEGGPFERVNIDITKIEEDGD